MNDMTEGLLDELLYEIQAYIGNPCDIYVKVYDELGDMGKLKLSMPFFLWKPEEMNMMFNAILPSLPDMDVVRVEFDYLLLKPSFFN